MIKYDFLFNQIVYQVELNYFYLFYKNLKDLNKEINISHSQILNKLYDNAKMIIL